MAKRSEMILAAGLSPAWQQILVVDEFRPGKVNRVRQVLWCASGKVLNVARALHHLGGPCQALAPVGGTTGQQIREDCERLGITARWTIAAASTRVCTTLVESGQGQVTEIVPESPLLTSGELTEFQSAFAEEAAAAEVIVLIGSLPPATSKSFYRDLLSQVRGKVVLDARGPELLDALDSRPFLVKPNRQELEYTLNRSLGKEDQLFEAMRELNHRGAEWVVISGGDAPVIASGPEGLYRLQAPPARVLNPIGCGDAMAAGMAWALAAGWDMDDVLRFGLAAAVDKLGRLLPGQVEQDRVRSLARAVTLNKA